MGPKASLAPTENRSPEFSVRSESLYRLSYPGPHNINVPLPYILEYTAAQLVEALRYKPEGRGFDCR